MQGLHEDLGRAHEIKSSSNRSFGLWIAAVLGLVGIWPLLRGTGTLRLPALAVGGAFLVAGLAVPAALGPLNRLWTRFGLLLGKVMNPIITGLIFALIVTPAGFVLRLLGKDLLRLRWDKSASSYWIRRDPPGPEPATMSNQF